MKKLISFFLCLTMLFSLCSTALADSEKKKEKAFESKVYELLGNTADMSDEEIREAFRKIAEENDVKLKEKDLDRIVDVCRMLEKMNPDDLAERAKLISENFYNGLIEVPDKFLSWLEDVGSGKYTLEDAKSGLFNMFGKAAGALSEFFGGIADFFSGENKK